jgi:type I restriction enzyme M protein
VVGLLVEMLEPRENTRIYDPCCGSGGMFIQSEKFIQEHGGRRLSASVFGQELNHTTWRLCKMNLAIRGIEADIREGDTFANDRHPDLKADFVLANPPFNMSEWGGQALKDDVRWKYGTPSAGNANYAWIQHFIHHLKPDGFAGFVMSNGSLSSNQSGEGEIRRKIIEADLVDCIIALPGQLFYTTQIPVSLWFLARNKGGDRYRRRAWETLFLDARKIGSLIDRTHRELAEADIVRIASKYHAWRGEKDAGEYSDEAGFCKSATMKEIAEHGFVLTPGRYVGSAEAEEDDEPFEEKMGRLTRELKERFAESNRLESVIRENIRRMGYEV